MLDISLDGAFAEKLDIELDVTNGDNFVTHRRFDDAEPAWGKTDFLQVGLQNSVKEFSLYDNDQSPDTGFRAMRA